MKTSLLLNLPKELDKMKELAVRVRVAGEGGLSEEVEKKLLVETPCRSGPSVINYPCLS